MKEKKSRRGGGGISNLSRAHSAKMLPKAPVWFIKWNPIAIVCVARQRIRRKLNAILYRIRPCVFLHSVRGVVLQNWREWRLTFTLLFIVHLQTLAQKRYRNEIKLIIYHSLLFYAVSLSEGKILSDKREYIFARTLFTDGATTLHHQRIFCDALERMDDSYRDDMERS